MREARRSLALVRCGEETQGARPARAYPTRLGPYEEAPRAVLLRRGGRLDDCARVRDILADVRFPQPARRRTTLDLDHVGAFIPKAIEMGRISLALATAIQFDAVMRQKDVVGEWEPIPEGEARTGIVLNGRR